MSLLSRLCFALAVAILSSAFTAFVRSEALDVAPELVISWRYTEDAPHPFLRSSPFNAFAVIDVPHQRPAIRERVWIVLRVKDNAVSSLSRESCLGVQLGRDAFCVSARVADNGRTMISDFDQGVALDFGFATNSLATNLRQALKYAASVDAVFAFAITRFGQPLLKSVSLRGKIVWQEIDLFPF